ncbi:MAG: hypothetical protein J0L65_11810 [Xanthomonadales bacterium]|nr:hypothetical protein [Xanthomonadales bacterium]
MTGNGQGVHAAMVASLRAAVNTQTYGAVGVLASAPTLHDIAHSIRRCGREGSPMTAMSRRWALLGSALLGWVGCVSVASAWDLHGQVSLTAQGRALRASETQDVVIYLQPDTPVMLNPPAEPVRIVTSRKAFVPRVTPVQRGSRVVFPNQDPILHNAFSSTPGAVFDVGLYGKDQQGEPVVLQQAGLVNVFCNVHHSMRAYVLVLDTPYFVRPDAQGRFVLRDLPAQAGMLHAWHERATPWKTAIASAPQAAIEVTLELTRRRLPAHLNKLGKPYPRSHDNAY